MTTKVTNEDFIVAWATSETMSDLVKATGLSRASVYNRAAALRRAGVKLPKLIARQTLTDPLYVAQLNSMIAKHDIRLKRGTNQ